MSVATDDALYALLPAFHRMRDDERGGPLRELLRVIGEQAGLLEADIARLYANCFIETCDDWAVPYIGELVGYRPVSEGGEAAHNRIAIPRREIANTIAMRRRKGTLALLELLARDVAGWQARAVEYYKLLGWTQHLNFQHPERGRTVDLRDGDALARRGGAFESIAHTIDIRRLGSALNPGRHAIGATALFVYRMRALSVTHTPAYLQEGRGGRRYSFSVLGNDTQLYVRPVAQTDPDAIAEEHHLPLPITRRALRDKTGHASAIYYGTGKSFSITAPGWPEDDAVQPIPPERILVADLSDWGSYRAPRGKVSVDPVLGRIAFPDNAPPARGVRVSYHYGAPSHLGGGEYPRALSGPENAIVLKVGHTEQYRTIGAALARWQTVKMESGARAAIIEITDSDVYTEALNVELEAGESLQLRAASLTRPILRLLDQVADSDDAFSIRGARASRMVLDGLLVTGRGLRLTGPRARSHCSGAEGELCDLRIRHCTLVPGWGVGCDCDPDRPNEPSITLVNTEATLVIEHSIVGTILVTANEVTRDPGVIDISDSILDATGEGLIALGATDQKLAFASLRIARTTVIGELRTHAITLAENCILLGVATVARRQIGCVRFSYVTPGSRTPRRFQCQPDADADPATAIAPRFMSLRYGNPAYCQLHPACPPEISSGADDGSEMGVFHDLYQPQRSANLRARLAEYTPAAMDAGIIYGN